MNNLLVYSVQVTMELSVQAALQIRWGQHLAWKYASEISRSSKTAWQLVTS